MMSLAESPIEKRRKAMNNKQETKKSKPLQQKEFTLTQASLTSSANKSTLQDEKRYVPHFGGMRAECINDDFLYRVSHVAGDLLDSASLVIRESGITIQTTDPQSIAVVIIDLPAKMFSSYRCEGHFVAHINMETLVGMLKQTSADNAKFKLTIEIQADNQETMFITIFDAKKCTTTQHIAKLWVPTDITIYFDDAQFDCYYVVSSKGWHEEITNLAHLVEQSKPIRICAGNDLKLSIDGDYGESSTIFKQNKTPGYKVVQKRVDPTAKDADGNYLFFSEIEGQVPQNALAASASSAGAMSTSDSRSAATTLKKKLLKKELKRRRNDENSESFEESNDLNRYAKPIVETEEENEKLIEVEPTIDEIKITLSMLLVRMVSKGLRQTPELYLMFKKNYPVMFVQRMKEHGHILIAISPKALEDGDNLANDADTDEQSAMNQLMALGKA